MADFPFISALEAIYNPATENADRHSAISQLEAALQQFSGSQLVSVGLDIAKTPGASPEISAYGASIVSRAVREGRCNPADVPCEEILSFLQSEDANHLHRVIANAFADIVVAVATLEWPQRYPNLVDMICPSSDLHTKPTLLRVLRSFVVVCDDPPYERLARAQIGALRRGIKAASSDIVQRVVGALFIQYSQGAAVAPASDMAVGLEVIEILSRSMSEQELWDCDLDSVCLTLMGFTPCVAEAVLVTASMLSRLQLGSLADARRALQFVQGALDKTADVVAIERWDAVQALLDAAASLASNVRETAAGSDDTIASDRQGCTAEVLDVCTQLRSNLASFALNVLSIPSIAFAATACDILLSVLWDNDVFQSLDVTGILAQLQTLIPKHRAHPGRSGGSPSAEFSRLQFATAEAFDTAFAELRAKAGAVLKRIGEALPALSTSFILHLVQNHLPPPTANDPRTPCGHVTQHSFTFTEWEATCFIIEQLEHALTQTNDHVREILSTVLVPAKMPSDAVLLPIYLNMILAFARFPLIDWAVVLEIVFTCMSLGPSEFALSHGRASVGDDIDLVAARKRAHTALIALCMQYSHQLFEHRDSIWENAQQLLVRSENLVLGEAGFLYEAVAALSNGMMADAQGEFLSRILAPMRNHVVEQCRSLEAKSLAELFMTSDRRQLHQRHTFLNELIILVSVLRRCNASPFMVALAQELLPAFGQLLVEMQSVSQYLSPEFCDLFFTMDSATVKQAQGGGNRQSSTLMGRRKSSEEKAHGFFVKLRQTLHQALGTIGKFIDPSSFADGWQQLISTAATMDVESMRSLCEHCLFPVGQSYPPIIVQLFPVIGQFMRRQAEACKGAGNTTDRHIAVGRWMHHFTKDTLSFVHTVVVASKLYQQEDTAARALVQLLHAIFVSAFDTRGVLSTIQPLMVEHLHSLGTNSDWPLRFFAMMCSEVRSNPYFNELDTRSILFSLADLYKKEFPKLNHALVLAGCGEDDVEKLNFALTMIPRIEGQRKKFGEVLLQILHEGNVVYPFENWQL